MRIKPKPAQRPWREYIKRPKPTPKRSVNAETDAAVAAFLARGGEIKRAASGSAVKAELNVAEIRIWQQAAIAIADN